MKLAIIGAGGARTPLLVNGLIRSDLPIREIALFDPDRPRADLMADIASRRAGRVSLDVTDRARDAIVGANFVFISIRVGGIDARAHDEATAMAHQIVGQETVGPGGFAKAMRTVPHVVGYAREVQAVAPDAWIINFTNPVGIVTQAVQTGVPGARIIGICDTPTELYEEVAHALDLPVAETHVDYFGLNHLGWIREVYHQGEPQLHRLWEEPARLDRVYRTPLFPPDLLRNLRLLPTEYVYYYYRAAEAYQNVVRAGTSRARVIASLNRRLFEDLAGAEDPVEVYERYIAARDAGYMQIESGRQEPRTRSAWGDLSGYDRIALHTVQGIHFNSNAIIPLNVVNRGNLPELQHDDVVEVPCVVNANGAHALHVGRVPGSVRELLMAVKAYERLTVQAALTSDPARAGQALAANPLVPDGPTADRLVAALRLT